MEGLYLTPGTLWILKGCGNQGGEACCGMVGSYAVRSPPGMSKLSVEVPGVSAGGGDSWGMEYQPRTPRRLIPSPPLVLSTKERR